MSSEIHTTSRQNGGLDCTHCGCGLGEARLAVQSYPAAAADSPIETDTGGLTLCPECATEAVELLDCWQDHDEPPVSAEQPIGDGYAAVAPDCSFCAKELSEPVVGIELYRRPGEQLPAYANYTLCPDCQGVFAEFLGNIR